jgi:dynein heavy chain 1
MLDSHEELYKWFTQQVAKNLHVVFTMNPPEAGLASKAATSPALFNRCVLDWFGDWPAQAFFQVGTEFTNALDLDVPFYVAPPSFPIVYENLAQPPSHRSAMVNAFISVHQSIYDINRRLAERQGRHNHVTPRHYLDFINQYVHLFNEKREDLEEQQRHLNVGLEKLRSTVVQVEELRKSLAVKRVQLEAKNVEANDKLQKMVSDQREAEQQKTASLQIQTALETQNIEIRERRDIVMADLAAAEPAVLDAQAAVSNIKKQHLTEVRSMANPPEAVKLAMESVCTVLGHQIDSWRTVQGIIRRDDFITSIVNFDTERQMTKRLRDKMNTEFLSKPAYNYENVNRASRACGPLVKWVLAQVGFSEILDRVGPLRAEVQSLEEQAQSTQRQASTILIMIGELETRIEQYKNEYAQLISETQAIKTEMEKVQSKVERSVTLLSSLESERDRWDTGSQRFEEQMKTIAGDVLLASAFLAYSGYYDQQHRESLLQRWTSHLEQAGISYRSDYSPVEYLSSAEERLSWGAHSLPADDLSTENAIILKRFKRYPLIIDPSGQAVTFVMQEYKNRKIAVTSFLDEAFLKNLESALRFGTALLIQDVEHLDPILNTVLNRELRRAGGRVLIRLGNQDIDYSPAFTMFLSTRDPSVNFAPDVCSRVVFANFTMTRASLQSQSLSQILRAERPDTEKSRTDLVKLQGEFRAKLQQLERSLLQALNESSGSILDDDKVIDTLETLKREAAEVTSKMEKTDTVMQEVEAVSSQYMPLASACSSIYFVLEQLSLLNHFYQFSLRFFQDVFDYVLLHNPSLSAITDPNLRLAKLTDDLFLHIYKRTARALLYADRIVLATLLAQIKLRGLGQRLEDEEFENFLDATSSLSRSVAAAPTQSIAYLSGEQNARLATLARLPAFKTIVQSMSEDSQSWTSTLTNPVAEAYIPNIRENDSGKRFL